MMLPLRRSASYNVGNAARRLSLSGSPAKIPETNGPTRRSSSSSVNFLRVNAAMDSSSAGGEELRKTSLRIELLVFHPSSPDQRNDSGELGTATNSPWMQI